MAELTTAQHAEIVTRFRQGEGYRTIAINLDLPWAPVRQVVREYLVGTAIWPETTHVTIDLGEVYDAVIKPHLQAYEARVTKRRKRPLSK